MKKLVQLLFVACCATSLTVHAAEEKTHTKEQMVAFVKKAVDYMNKHGEKEAFEKFSNKADTDFHDGELYIYVYKYDGTCVAHGVRPTLIGQDGFQVKDPDGNYPNRELAAKAKKDKKGFVQFKWSNPVHDKVENKLGYVEDYKGKYYIGSGIYPKELNP
jgi:cytochrome c